MLPESTSLASTSAITAPHRMHFKKGVRAEDRSSPFPQATSDNEATRAAQNPSSSLPAIINFGTAGTTSIGGKGFIIPVMYADDNAQLNSLKRKAAETSLDVLSQETIPNVAEEAIATQHKVLQDVATSTLNRMEPKNEPRKLRKIKKVSFNIEDVIGLDDEDRMVKGRSDADGDYVSLQG